MEHPSLTAFEMRESRYEQVGFAADGEDLKVDRPFPFTVVPRLLAEPGNAWRQNL